MLYSAEAIKKICLEAGADDAGLVDIDRGSLEKEREGILQVCNTINHRALNKS